jgi:hypothetical protein
VHEIEVFLDGLPKISNWISTKALDSIYLDESGKEFLRLRRGVVYCDDMNGLGLGRHSIDSSGYTCKYRTIEKEGSKNDEVLDSFRSKSHCGGNFLMSKRGTLRLINPVTCHET